MKRFWKIFRQGLPGVRNEQRFRPIILITGCGSGLGLATAELLYRQKQYRVVATARRGSMSHLRKLFPESDHFRVRPLNVLSATDRESLIREIERDWGPVNVLVNNAGISYRTVMEHMNDRDEHKQMATNYFGPMGLIRRVLPRMRERGRGKIINISSVSGMLAMPTMASYSASKYALEGASEALWHECKPWGINVSLIQPGFIRSKSFERVRQTEKARHEIAKQGPYSDYYAAMSPFVARLMGLSLTTPESFARLILRTIRKQNPPLWIPATLDAFVFSWLRRLVPRRWLLPLLFSCLPRARTWARGETHKRV